MKIRISKLSERIDFKNINLALYVKNKSYKLFLIYSLFYKNFLTFRATN